MKMGATLIRAMREAEGDYEEMCRLAMSMTKHELGQGCFGTAYKLDDGMVLKIGSCVDRTAAYIHQVARVFADTGKPLSFAPKVWHYESYGDAWYAVMEEVRVRSDWIDELGETLDCRGTQLYCTTHPEQYKAALQFIREIEGCDENGETVWSLDDHAGNWGVAEDGRFVIFDPLLGLSTRSTGRVQVNAHVPRGRTQAMWKRAPIGNLYYMR